jgi:hypothetical protein
MTAAALSAVFVSREDPGATSACRVSRASRHAGLPSDMKPLSVGFFFGGRVCMGMCMLYGYVYVA